MVCTPHIHQCNIGFSPWIDFSLLSQISNKMVVQTSDLPPNDSVGPRSARLRKLSQKAKEIAEAIQPATPTTPTSVKSVKAVRSAGKSKSASKPKKKKSSSAATAKVKAGGKRGRAIVDEDGDVQIEEVDSQQHVAEPEEDDDALYCICLGHDDHTPMIQCEECENWSVTFVLSYPALKFSILMLFPARSGSISPVSNLIRLRLQSYKRSIAMFAKLVGLVKHTVS